MDIALTLRSAIRSQGLTCEIRSSISSIIPTIILGANLIRGSSLSGALPSNAIILNMEQMYDASPWLVPSYIDLLKTHTVWDYNESNQRYLKTLLNRDDIPLIRLGYTPELEFNCLTDQNIDVLFYGEINQRRRDIANQLEKAGIKSIVFNMNIVGSEKTVLIARSKIVLNLHYYAAGLFEIPRVYHLLHRKKFVISEESSNMEEYDHLKGGFVVCPYEQIVATVLDYLNKPDEREKIALLGYEKIRATQTIVPKIESLTYPTLEPTYEDETNSCDEDQAP